MPEAVANAVAPPGLMVETSANANNGNRLADIAATQSTIPAALSQIAQSLNAIVELNHIMIANGLMADLDTSLLRVFVTVTEHGSMTAGAKALHLTQGAVSQKIARLEAQAGRPLLTRERRGLKLTADGQRLLCNARRMLAVNDEIWSQMNDGALDGQVRLGLPVDLMGPLFVPILRRFLDAHPHIELPLQCGSSNALKALVASGSLDVAILEAPQSRAEGECLLIDRLRWVGMRGGTAHTRSPLPISLGAEDCCFRPEILSSLKRSGREARIVFENAGLEATLAIVRSDMAVSAWLASTVPPDLAILDTDERLPRLPFYAVTLQTGRGKPNRSTAALIREIREAFDGRLSRVSGQ